MHRNLMMCTTSFRDVKIFDLGLTKEITSDVPRPWHRTTVVGSPRYCKFRPIRVVLIPDQSKSPSNLCNQWLAYTVATVVAICQPDVERCDVYLLALLNCGKSKISRSPLEI